MPGQKAQGNTKFLLHTNKVDDTLINFILFSLKNDLHFILCPIKSTQEQILHWKEKYFINQEIYHSDCLRILGLLGQSTESISFDDPLLLQSNSMIGLFTSGSTSGEFAVLIEHSFQTLLKSAKNTVDFFHFKKGETSVLSLPIAHIGGFQILTRCILSFGTLSIPPLEDSFFGSKHMEDYFILQNKKSDYISFVLPQLAYFLTFQNPQDYVRKQIFLGGMPFNNQIIQECLNKNLPIKLCYGLTESASMVAINDPKKNHQRYYSINSNEISFTTRTGNVGSLIILPQGIKVQDKVRIFKDGSFKFLSRLDNTIIKGGENIDLNEIQQTVEKSFPIQMVKALKLKHHYWGEVYTLLILEKQDSTLDKSSIYSCLLKKYNKFKMPIEILILNTYLLSTFSLKLNLTLYKKIRPTIHIILNSNVTKILPVFESIIKQTYPFWELLIIKSKKGQILYNSLSQKYPFIKYLESSQSIPNDHTIFLESDDLWEEEKLMRHVYTLKEINL